MFYYKLLDLHQTENELGNIENYNFYSFRLSSAIASDPVPVSPLYLDKVYWLVPLFQRSLSKLVQSTSSGIMLCSGSTW